MKVLASIGAVLLTLAAIAALVALSWGFTFNDLAMLHFFAPKYEAVRRETFEQSKAYNQGMIQELQNMEFQYEQASPEHKAALRSIILHRAADYPANAMPSDLYNFVQNLKHNPQ